MDLEAINAIKERLYRLFQCVAGPFPGGVQVDELAQDVHAGEEGLALEMFCSQIYEYEIVISDAAKQEIEALGRLLGLEPMYWECLQELG